MSAATKALFESRQNAETELRSLYTEAGADELSADQAEVEKRCMTTIDDTSTRIERLEKMEKRTAIADASADTNKDLRLPAGVKSDEDEKPSELEQLRMIGRNELRSLDLAAPDVEYRAAPVLDISTATLGQETIPTTLYRQLLDFIESESIIMQSGATIMRTTSGEKMTFPIVDSHSVAAQVDEGALIGQSGPTFTTADIDAYKYGVMGAITFELTQDSVFDLGGYLSQDLGRSIGRKMNTDFVLGAGTTGPEGIVNATVGATLAANNAVTFEEVLDLMQSVPSAYRSRASSFIFADDVAWALRRIVDGNGNYIWQPSTQVGQPDTLFGRAVRNEYNLDGNWGVASKVVGLYGDFSGFYIRLVGSIRMERSDEFYFGNDMVAYRVLARADSRLINSLGLRTMATPA